jgi:phage tail-like protein
MALLSGTDLRVDPVLAQNFVVNLIESPSGTSSLLSGIAKVAAGVVADVLLGGFSECSGLEMSMTPHEYEQGGDNGRVLRFANRVKWTNIKLSRGIASNTALWDWHAEFVRGRGRRRDGVITLLDAQMVPRAIWHFSRGLPVKFTGPTMNAGTNTIAIEQIEIAHEGIISIPGVGIGGALASGLLGGDVAGGLAGAASGAAGLAGSL